MQVVRRMLVASGVACVWMTLGGRTAWAVDVCSLLSPTEAASVLGVPEVNAGAAPNRCIWTPKKYQKGAGVLTVIVEGAKDPAKMMGMGTAVSGVGDEALQEVLPKSDASLLHVRKGNTWFNVSVHGVPLDQAPKMEQTAGALIAGRL